MISEQQLQTIRELIKTGRRPAAAAELRQLLQTHPRDFRLWLLLASIAPADKRADCVNQAARLAPDAPAVRKAQLWLAQTAATPQAPPQTPPPPQADLDLAHLRQKAAAHQPAAASAAAQPPRRRNWGWLLAVFALILIGSGLAFWSTGRTADAPSSPPEHVVPIAAIKNTPAAAADSLAVLEPTPPADPPPVEEQAPTSTPTPTPQLLVAKNIAASSLVRERWTPTPTPTNTPTPTPTIEPTAVIDNYTQLNWPDVGPNERWINVNLTTQTLVAYEGTTPVMETVISSGRPPYYTVTGQFRIYYRLESQTMDGRRLGFDYVTPGVPWVQYFYGDFALHGAFWHNDFGTPVSHGCVNLTVDDAEWLYGWADYGTLVNVHY